MLRKPLFLAFALAPALSLAPACDKEPAPQPTANTPVEKKAEKPQPTAEPPAHKVIAKPQASDPKKVDLAESERKRKLFVDHVQAGRTATKAKDYATAIKAFEQAVEIEAKAGILGELGWALYLAGELEKAEKVLMQAIANPAKDNTKGALLYNLGRVHEDKGDKDKAVSFYEKSLAARPNKIVQARMDGLVSAGAHSEPDACAWHKMPGSPPKNLCQHYTPEDAAGSVSCLEGDEEAGASKIRVKQDGVQATTFASFDEEGMATFYVLAVLRDNAWYTYEFAYEYIASGYRGDSVEIKTLELVDAIPGGKPELHLEWEFDSHQGDLEYNELTTLDETYHGYVSLEDEAPRWIATVRSDRLYEVGEYYGDDEFKGIKHSEDYGTKVQSGVEWTFSATDLSVTTKAKAKAPAPVGTFKIADYPAKCTEYYGITSVQE